MVVAEKTRTDARDALLDLYRDKLETDLELDRATVSSQADKSTPFYRWYRYREGFTSLLVQYALKGIGCEPGELLDPFAGSATALFAGRTLGWSTTGIELLPVGHFIVEARLAAERVDPDQFSATARELSVLPFERYYDARYQFRHIAITDGAFPADTERQLVGYVAYCNQHLPAGDIRTLALFAAFAILESISYTRKDGHLRFAQNGEGGGGSLSGWKKGLP